LDWAERAIHGDTFKPDNQEMKQSSSVMDLFQFISEAAEFLKNLEWPDDLQNAKFATSLAKVYPSLFL
jgi:MUN domain